MNQRAVTGVTIGLFLALSLACASGPMQKSGMLGVQDSETGCENFVFWEEILSPFEGERCFLYMRTESRNGIICRPTELVQIKACANPQNSAYRDDN